MPSGATGDPGIAAESLTEREVGDEPRHIDRLLPQQDIGQQRNRLDVAAQPAIVDGRHCAHASTLQFGGCSDERLREHEHRGRHALGKRMIAWRNASGDLDVNRLIGEIVQFDQPQDQIAPPVHSVRIVQTDTVEACLQAAQVIVEPSERRAAVERELAQAAVTLVATGSHAETLRQVAALRPAVDRFFVDVMVMVDNAPLRTARLSLLAAIEGRLLDVADFTRLQA